MRRLRVLQVGLGDWGRDWAWRVVPAVPEVEAAGYIDSDTAAFDALSRHLEIDRRLCFTSLRDAIESTQPDALLVTTTIGAHEPLARAGLEAGLHVLVEKPFTDDLAQAQALVSLAEERGRVLMVSQNYRWFPAPRLVAELVRGGSLGRLYAAGVDFRHNSASPPQPRVRHHSDPQPLLVDMSVHHFDLMRMLLGQEALRISCEASTQPWSGFAGPSTAIASIVFEGVLVSYRGSWTSSAPNTPWAGEWEMEFEGGRVFWTSRGDEGVLKDRVVVRRRGRAARVVALPAASRIDRAGTLTEFAAAIAEGREPETSGRDNLRTLALTLAAVRSAAGSGWVEPARPPAGRAGSVNLSQAQPRPGAKGGYE
jgi:predicted dehydrogenase